MKNQLDFNEILSTSAERSNSPIDFLKNVSHFFQDCAPAEKRWIASFLDIYSVSIIDLPFNRDAPFMWAHFIDINNKVFNINGMIKTFIASNHYFWKKINDPKCLVRSFPYLSYDFQYKSSLFAGINDLVFLVYKYNQPTGAHLTPKTLDRFSNTSVFDVYEKSAAEVLDFVKDYKSVILNSMQLTDIWGDFDEFLRLLSIKDHSINWLSIYFHEPIEKILKYVESPRFHQYLALSPEINISLSFLTDNDREVVGTCLRNQGKLKHLKLHTLANILPFSSNKHDFVDPEKNLCQCGKVGDNLFLTIGSVQPRKGVDFLKNLARDGLIKKSSSSFVWLGMPNKYSVEEWSNIPSNLFFLGYIKHSYKWFVMYNVTALIVPSESEPYSLAAAEALISGRPVLYREGRCGLLDSLSTLQPNTDSICPLSDTQFASFLFGIKFNHFLDSLDQDIFLQVRRHLLSIMNPGLYLNRLNFALKHRTDYSAYSLLSFYRDFNRDQLNSSSIVWKDIFSK